MCRNKADPLCKWKSWKVNNLGESRAFAKQIAVLTASHGVPPPVPSLGCQGVFPTQSLPLSVSLKEAPTRVLPGKGVGFYLRSPLVNPLIGTTSSCALPRQGRMPTGWDGDDVLLLPPTSPSTSPFRLSLWFGCYPRALALPCVTPKASWPPQ